MSNDPQKMLDRLRGNAAKPKTQQNVLQIKTTEELAQQSQETGRWNESLLDVTKNLVREGRSDAEIHAVTDQLTTSHYTVQDTRNQVQPMIDGARSKPLGKFHPNVANTFLVLTETERWASVFAYDEFNDRNMVIAKPPWQTGDPKYFKPRPLIDTDYTHTLIWLQRNWANVGEKAVIRAVDAVCRENIITPVRHYLESLPESDFDIGSLFETYFGVVPSHEMEREYVQAASALFLKQACARAVYPGCKADIVIVIEGKQGVGKSRSLRALFGADWFKDSLPPMGSKDASAYVVGAWCIELAEMAFKIKAETEQQKAFLSRQDEKYRPAYGRNSVTYPRRCIFVATTNRDDWAVDDTGNRRYLPIKVGKIDVDGLKRDRDLIWAAAVAELKRTNHWWLDDSLVQYAHLQTEARREADIWSELVQKHIRSDETSITEAFELCFPRDDDAPPLDPKTISKQDQRRMGTALIAAGFERDGVFTSGARRNQTRFTRAHEVDYDCEF